MKTKEMTDIIYDTLMKNVDEIHPQFDISEVNDCEVDAENNRIYFDYQGQKFGVEVYKRF